MFYYFLKIECLWYKMQISKKLSKFRRNNAENNFENSSSILQFLTLKRQQSGTKSKQYFSLRYIFWEKYFKNNSRLLLKTQLRECNGLLTTEILRNGKEIIEHPCTPAIPAPRRQWQRRITNLSFQSDRNTEQDPPQKSKNKIKINRSTIPI